MLQIRVVSYASPEYDSALALRYEILRKPLSLNYSEADLELEASDIHLIAIKDGQLAGCLLLRPGEQGRIKMRQVAVAPAVQNSGIGRKLVEASERWALENGFNRMELHARETAVPFYQSLGYAPEGDGFIEVTLPHRFMFKKLGAEKL